MMMKEWVMGLYELKETESFLKKWVKGQKITAILMTGPLRPGMGLFWYLLLFVLGKKKQPKERARDDFPFRFHFFFFFLDRNFLFTTIKILESLSKFPFHSLIFVCPFYCPSTSTASLFSTLLAQLLFVKNQLISACIIKLFFFSFLCKTNHMKKKNKIKKPQYFGRSQISVSNLFLFFIL